MADQNNTPGTAQLAKDHVNYAVGYGKETIGSVTGSEAWKQDGRADKQAAVEGMKAASANRDPQQSGYGKVEEAAGKAFGCEGMENEGAQSKTQ